VNILFSFRCGTTVCGWAEDIGVDVRTGLVIKGDITFVCPKCGHITTISDFIAMLPVIFLPPGHK